MPRKSKPLAPPALPVPGFKWKWASLQCTEGLNDPVVLLGVLFRMRKLELLNTGLKYSSPEFSKELLSLSADVSDSVGVKLASRGGERNIIRNSGQYWKALGLIPPTTHGLIALTPFGREVADRQISQSEFAALTILTLRLPNPAVQPAGECQLWRSRGIDFRPLLLLLDLLLAMGGTGLERSLTTEELTRIVIPLSATKASVDQYVECLAAYRSGKLDLATWPDCCPESNDMRIAREFLLFLKNYGYLTVETSTNRLRERYTLNPLIEVEIADLVRRTGSWANMDELLDHLRADNVASEVERKRTAGRPFQSQFRKAVIAACQRCLITNASMPEVLEAAHIKPYKYNGEDTVANGFALRTDIHLLFDTGHLRIAPTGEIQLSTRARLDYGSQIPPRVLFPDFTNVDYVRWRWENYNGY